MIERQGLLANAERIGQRIRDGIAQACPATKVRGMGLMIGIELDRPCADLVKLALADGLLINVTAERVVRLLPPLIFTEADADELVGRLSVLVNRFLAAK